MNLVNKHTRAKSNPKVVNNNPLATFQIDKMNFPLANGQLVIRCVAEQSLEKICLG